MRRTLLMIAAFALLLTQCRKPVVEYPMAEPTNENMVSMTVTVGHGGKTEITGTGAITWSAGDKLYVGDGEKYIGYLTLQGTGGLATGTFSGSVTADVGTYTFGFYYLGSGDYTSSLESDPTSVDISFASQTGVLDDASSCHIGYGTANGKVEDGNVILASTDPVTMTSKVAIAYFEFKKDDDSGYEGAITLSGTNICNEMTVKFSGAESGMFTGKEGTAGKAISLTNTSSSEKYVMLVPTGTGEETLEFGGAYEGTTKFYKGIEANKFYCVGAGDPIEVVLTKVPSYLPGEFTVDAIGTKVKFAPGNLQYLGQAEEGHKWRFAEHQWDIMGDGPNTTTGKKGNVNLGDAYAGKYNTGSGEAGGSETDEDKEAARDLFGWGCTGYQDTRSTDHENWYQMNYQPYSTSKSSIGSSDPAYSINRYKYGPDYYSDSKYNLTVENKSDWGCLEIGDDPAETWRTLTGTEWEYLLKKRTTTTTGLPNVKSRYAKVTVDEVSGMLLFPDSFAWDATKMGTAPTATNTADVDYSSGSYTAAQFAEQEKSGVVFLPATGQRSGASITKVGSQGTYWSTSCYSSQYCCCTLFDAGQVQPNKASNCSRQYGFSVRLVWEVRSLQNLSFPRERGEDKIQ